MTFVMCDQNKKNNRAGLSHTATKESDSSFCAQKTDSVHILTKQDRINTSEKKSYLRKKIISHENMAKIPGGVFTMGHMIVIRMNVRYIR